jgi:hypothetical protein
VVAVFQNLLVFGPAGRNVNLDQVFHTMGPFGRQGSRFIFSQSRVALGVHHRGTVLRS